MAAMRKAVWRHTDWWNKESPSSQGGTSSGRHPPWCWQKVQGQGINHLGHGHPGKWRSDEDAEEQRWEAGDRGLPALSGDGI